MRLRELRALAVDYDRTLTDESLVPAPAALDALAALRRAGKRVVVVSGRDLAFLERELGHVTDAIVAENGCILVHAGQRRTLGPAHDGIHDALVATGVPLERGEILASADVEHEALLQAALEKAGLRADLIRNRDRVMVLPSGVDKALGVLAALEALDVAPQEAAAAGDGENDVPMLRAVGFAVAVENAVPELKAVADRVTTGFGGDGLAAWIRREWLPQLREAPA